MWQYWCTSTRTTTAANKNKTNKTIANTYTHNHNNARTLINDEVSLLLENLATHSIHGVARGGVGKEIFNKSREYVMRFQRFKSKEAAEAVKARLTSQGMTSFEVGCFCNLVPESAEEAKAIIPTLARFENEELSALIEDVYQYRSHA